MESACPSSQHSFLSCWRRFMLARVRDNAPNILFVKPHSELGDILLHSTIFVHLERCSMLLESVSGLLCNRLSDTQCSTCSDPVCCTSHSSCLGTIFYIWLLPSWGSHWWTSFPSFTVVIYLSNVSHAYPEMHLFLASPCPASCIILATVSITTLWKR